MKLQRIRIGEKEVMPFTIPSGILMTDIRCAERMLRRIPEIGIWTTKSIGVNERIVPERDEVDNPIEGKEYGFRESVFAQVDENTFVNAVRLTNPGKDKMRENLLAANIPKDRVINASVFGGTVGEFVSVIKTLEDVVDCFEGNFSCPHSEKGGMAIGIDPKAVYEFTRACVSATRKPFIAKLSPNTNLIYECTKAAYEAGAFGVALIT
ncbi:MAG: hypothetical protein AABX54_03055 [Nanoarchaeota archaeon]